MFFLGGGGGGAGLGAGVVGRQVAHQGGDGAVVLVVGQQLQGAGLEARAQEVRPPGVHRRVLGRCVHTPMMAPLSGRGCRDGILTHQPKLQKRPGAASFLKFRSK